MQSGDVQEILPADSDAESDEDTATLGDKEAAAVMFEGVAAKRKSARGALRRICYLGPVLAPVQIVRGRQKEIVGGK